MDMSISKLKRTRKDTLINYLINAQLKAELHSSYSADLERELRALRRQSEPRGSAPRSVWLTYFDLVKRDRNPHGRYINCRIRSDCDVPDLDTIQTNLLPYARKISGPKIDKHRRSWINVYY